MKRHLSDANPRRTQALQLATLWQELVAGTQRIHAAFHSDERFFIALEEQSPKVAATRPSADRFAILERVLLGESQKSIALELGVAISTVSLACHACLSAIGARCAGARAPMILVMVVHAAHGFECASGRLLRDHDPDAGRTVLSVERPDRELDARLSGAERQIARFLVEGYSYTQIARLRNTSQRTVANQVSAIFCKLGVSGRAELLALLVRARPGRSRLAALPPPA
jgi:DNA-binding NarL/FixJ family response regulator